MIDADALARVRALVAEPVLAGVLSVLNPAGEETRVVGGAVRNALLGIAVQDVDLGTTMVPEEVSRRAKAAGWQVVPTGIEHGTLTLVQAGCAFEVTTLREDIETDGRRAVVRFGQDFTHDAARRDFTINALSMGPDGVLHDYFGGAADLAARRVRFIGDADQRLSEDYLRGLRFFRFSAAYGSGQLDPAGFAAVLRHRQGFAQLSRERVRQEMLKLLMAERALPVIEQAETEGILSEILGFVLDVRAFTQALRFAGPVNVDLDAMARLVALAGPHAGDGAALWQGRLRLSNAEIKTLNRYAQAVACEAASPRLLRYRFGEQALPALVLRVAMGADPEHELPERLMEAHKPAPEFLITGADIVAAGVLPGPRVGQILAHIEADWIAAGLPADREAQRRFLEAAVDQQH